MAGVFHKLPDLSFLICQMNILEMLVYTANSFSVQME